MVWRVLDHTIYMAREVPSRNALYITLCRENRRIILKIGCVTYPNTSEGRKSYEETLIAERSKPQISIPTIHTRVWHIGEYKKNAYRITLKTDCG